jgi:hypothetical protein
MVAITSIEATTTAAPKAASSMMRMMKASCSNRKRVRPQRSKPPEKRAENAALHNN